MSVPEIWRYLVEWVRIPYEAYMHGIKRVIYTGKTRFQQVDIVETYSFGKCLFLDGKLQSSEYDEKVYHEALVHPAMMTHPNPRRVLVVGGGEGATIREVLRHPVEKVVMVDLDRELVELCRKHMPEWSQGAFEDPRLELVFSEGRKFLEKCGEKFDVIILDLVDPTPNSPALKLYTREFYQIVRERLTPQGVAVTQATSLRFSLNAFAAIRNTLAQVFPVARAYAAPVMSFLSLWGFALASLGRDPLQVSSEELKERIARLKGELDYYDERVHRHMFHLPKFIRKRMEEIKDVSTDENPTYMPP